MMIQFSQVSKRYANGTEALSNIDFHMNEGEMVFITGHSGAGKTTLLKLIALLETISEGTILIDKVNLAQVPRRSVPSIRKNIGIILQQPNLLSNQTVFTNVALPLYIDGISSREIRKRVQAALSKVGLLHKENVFPETLSCGEQQRINIARAIVRRPPIVLADEPTGNLDSNLAKDIFELFGQFNQLGITFLVVSHDTHLIETLDYRRLTLKEGKLVV